jgi:hypothetical protein
MQKSSAADRHAQHAKECFEAKNYEEAAMFGHAESQYMIGTWQYARINGYP